METVATERLYEVEADSIDDAIELAEAGCTTQEWDDSIGEVVDRTIMNRMEKKND